MKPIDVCVPAALAELLRYQPLTDAKLSFAWRWAVGPAVERVTEIRLDPKGALEVRVPDPNWRREVDRSRNLILARLQRLLGVQAVKDLHIIVRGAQR